jgi:hypothetical protein
MLHDVVSDYAEKFAANDTPAAIEDDQAEYNIGIYSDILTRLREEERKDANNDTQNLIGKIMPFSIIGLLLIISLSAIIAAFLDNEAFQNILALLKEMITISSSILAAIFAFFFAKETRN